MINVILLEEEAGFRKSTSCINGVFQITWLIQDRRKCNLQIHLVFVSYENVFGKVNGSKLFVKRETKTCRKCYRRSLQKQKNGYIFKKGCNISDF